jgi:hypothetical protein
VAVFLIRLAIVVLGAAAVAIAAAPILVLIDLLQGSDGYGLCPGGISLCERPYSTGPELLIVLVLALFLIVFSIRLLSRLTRRLRADSYQASR